MRPDQLTSRQFPEENPARPPAMKIKIDAKPLIAAIEWGAVPKAQRILAENPEMAHGDDGAGWTPLMSACRLRSPELVQELVNLGAEVNVRNPLNPATGEGDNFALWYAAFQNQPYSVEVAQILMENGAQVNMVGEFGETPLHQAATWDNAALAEYLLSMGAYVNAEVVKGKTALSIALKWNNEAVAMVLRQYGAKEPLY